MKPFNVRLKLENYGVVEYVEINLFGTQFRLMQDKIFSVNGIKKSVPYSVSEDIKVFINGNFLTFATTFGMEIIWEGTNHVEIKICDEYAGNVCGMCGDGIGINKGPN